MASWVAGRVSSSRTRRRNLVSQAKQRSTTQRRWSRTKPLAWSGRLTIATARSQISPASRTNRAAYRRRPTPGDRGERLAQRGGDGERTVAVLQGGGRDHDGQRTRTPGRTGNPRQPLSYQESFTFRADRPPTERGRT